MKNNYFYPKPLANIYATANVRSETSTQILYGEKFKILKKSNNLNDAYEQISWQVGKQTTFFTGLALARKGGKEVQSCTITSHVFYRDSQFVSESLVKDYIQKEKPLNCAGSTKFESLGICFLKRVETEDPSALMGLPLITLCSFLKKWNVQPFA